MTRILAAVLWGMLASSAMAQDTIEVTPLDPVDPNAIADPSTPDVKAEVPTKSVGQAVLRGIDKLDGTAEDIVIDATAPRKYGLLDISLKECRYPEDNPSGEAFAFLTIKNSDSVIFSGWMIASSPALNALDDPRYDVWVLRCKTSDTVGASE